MVTKQMMTDDAHDDVVIVGVDKGQGANKHTDRQRPEVQTNTLTDKGRRGKQTHRNRSHAEGHRQTLPKIVSQANTGGTRTNAVDPRPTEL